MQQNYYPNNYYNSGINPYYQASPYMTAPQIYNCPFLANQGYMNLPNQGYRNLPDSWSFGPLKIEWTFSGESINLVVKMFENAVKEILLTLSKPTIDLKLNLGETNFNLTVNADFMSKFVSISGAVCFETICVNFDNTVIARW